MKISLVDMVDMVDTVGAGDAFLAGQVSELPRGRCIEEGLSMAVRTGAFCLARPRRPGRNAPSCRFGAARRNRTGLTVDRAK
jgi:sugar/nucleoside kinase (ribokinase family)